MLGSAREAERVVGWLDCRAETHSGRRIGIVELVAEDRHETREVYVGIRSVARKNQVGEDLRERLIGTGRITGKERIREIGKRILVRQPGAEGLFFFRGPKAHPSEEQVYLFRIGSNPPRA